MTLIEIPAAAVEAAPSEAALAAAALHARCDRRQCEDCDDDFDECEARWRDDHDAYLCGDCDAWRSVQAEDDAAWRARAYR